MNWTPFNYYAHITVSHKRVNIDVSSICAACIKMFKGTAMKR